MYIRDVDALLVGVYVVVAAAAHAHGAQRAQAAHGRLVARAAPAEHRAALAAVVAPLQRREPHLGRCGVTSTHQLTSLT